MITYEFVLKGSMFASLPYINLETKEVSAVKWQRGVGFFPTGLIISIGFTFLEGEWS